MPKNSLKLQHTIICDDIRREDNGKFLLIGVYPETIMLNILPAQLLLGIWLQFKVLLHEKVTMEFEISGNPLQEPVSFNLDIGEPAIFGKEEVFPVIVKIPFNLTDEGPLTINYRRKGDTAWFPAYTAKVQLHKAPTLN